MKTPLQSILTVRVKREDRLSHEFVEAKRQRALAEEDLVARRKAYTRWDETKDSRRDEIFSKVMNVVVPRSRIDSVRRSIRDVDMEGVNLSTKVTEAEGVVETRKGEELAAHNRFVMATKERIKIEEQKKDEDERLKKDEEYRVEMEMEDFQVRRQERDDSVDND